MIIYGLYDPRQPARTRYVGMTSGPLRERVQSHVGHARQRKGRNHRACWIRSLLRDGVRPQAQVLEVLDVLNWQEREQFWIRRLAPHGLTNATGGGEGMPSPSEETRARLSASHRGRKASTETIERLRVSNGPRARLLAAANKGSTRPAISEALKRAWAEGRRKPLPQGAYTRTPEQRARHSAALKAAVTPEFRARMSEIRKRIESEKRKATNVLG